MLIAGDATFQGMLSGGCLEGDLADRALAVLRTNTPQCVTYDLGRKDEELWGLGVGCDGLMRIFLQPLLPEREYQPFAAIAEVLSGDDRGVATTVLESRDGLVAPGATVVLCGGEVTFCGVPDAYRDPLVAASRAFVGELQSRTRVLDMHDGEVKVLMAQLSPPPRLLILGAGLDAQPVLRLALELGWRVTVQDHRPAYIERGGFAAADKVTCFPADELASRLALDRYDAVIVMSHHLTTDRSYLKILAKSRISYVGLLGPPDRRFRLMADLGEAAKSLERRMHGPAGFDIGADGPASIALSILAEVHTALKKKSPGRAVSFTPG
jgi:xanthine/CO dehydrogenase XdhC/CoxF family maturation factor